MLRSADLLASIDASVGCAWGAACGSEQSSIFLLFAVLSIKLMDELDAAGQVTLRLPGVSLKAVASPADQVLSLSLFVLAFAYYSFHLIQFLRGHHVTIIFDVVAIREDCRHFFPPVAVVFFGLSSFFSWSG